MRNTYETIIGLEIHVELLTSHKAFCSCPNRFGDVPNTNKCPICEGLPGAIPVFNDEVKGVATKAGLILNCEINELSAFDRKNYFYPDLPKGFQITQFHKPLCTNGYLDLPSSGRRINITEIHIEEDAAKLIHEGDKVFVDYNRCGVPLIEIVTAPDFRDATEVVEFLSIVQRSFVYANISDCKIEQGSMRADVNLSVHKPGEAMGTRTETKNMASFKAITKAIETETNRQIALLEAGKVVTQETRRWDENSSQTIFMRIKEDANDYKYHVEPDLSALIIGEDFLSEVRSSIPELPYERAMRYVREYGLTEYEADILTSSAGLINLYEGTIVANNLPKASCNWILTHVLKLMNDYELTLNPVRFAALVSLVEEGKISSNAGRDILKALFTEDFDVYDYAVANNMLMITDEEQIRSAVRAALELEECSKAVCDYLGGNEKTFGFLMGRAMRLLGGKADPSIVGNIMRAELDTKK